MDRSLSFKFVLLTETAIDRCRNGSTGEANVLQLAVGKSFEVPCIAAALIPPGERLDY